MNVLEVYIVEIYKEKPYEFDEDKHPSLKEKEFVKVKYKGDCHGAVSIIEDVVSIEDWERDKDRGYTIR